MRFFALIILVANSVSSCYCIKESGKFSRLIRGDDVDNGQIPYAVRIRLHNKIKGKTSLCGGSLISPNWILSAAHCFEKLKSIEVRLGSIFKDSDGIVYEVEISDIRLHPNYKSSNLLNDIALIKIPPTKLGRKIAVVPLPKINGPHPKYEKAYAKVCGWGKTTTYGKPSNILQCGRTQILKIKDCPPLLIAYEKICTATNLQFATPSFGDSGGPLVLEATGELVGIISAVSNNCHSGSEVPALYTPVVLYLDWIKSISGISY